MGESKKSKPKTKKSATILLPSSNNFMPILVIISIGLAFVAGALWQKVQNIDKLNTKVAGIAGSGSGNQAAPSVPKTAGDVDPVTAEDHIKGNRDARIVLVEYSDLECPFCKRFHPTAQQVVDEYNGDVAWVYRHFPLDQLHSKADKEAEAVECANELAGNDGFWALVDKIFEETPSNNGLTLDDLPKLAAEVGLDESSFKTCLDSGKYADHVESNYQSGLKAGVTGTPGNILLDTKTGETQLIPGAVPFPQVQQAVDAMLAKN